MNPPSDFTTVRGTFCPGMNMIFLPSSNSSNPEFRKKEFKSIQNHFFPSSFHVFMATTTMSCFGNFVPVIRGDLRNFVIFIEVACSLKSLDRDCPLFDFLAFLGQR